MEAGGSDKELQFSTEEDADVANWVSDEDRKLNRIAEVTADRVGAKIVKGIDRKVMKALDSRLEALGKSWEAKLEDRVVQHLKNVSQL